MISSFYTLLKGDSNDRFEAMWAKTVRSDFSPKFYIIVNFIQNSNIKKKLTYLFSTTLRKPR